MAWSQEFEHGDPGLMLFGASLRAGAPMVFGHGDDNPARRFAVLEIGCCEADWLHPAGDAWPDCWFSGIDTRAPSETERDGKVIRSRADVMQGDNFAPDTFDAIVSLSAIEHIGLGHYGDPKHPDGDSIALANAWRWLKPGGWFYLDVPYAPLGYRVCGTSHRQYDDEALSYRLRIMQGLNGYSWVLKWSGYAPKREAGRLVERPVTQSREDDFDHYVSMVLEKA